MSLHNIQPDISQAEEFFEFMLGEEDEIDFRTLSETGENQFARKVSGRFDIISKQLIHENKRGNGVFWLVNKARDRAQNDASIESVRALFVDLDGSPVEPLLENQDALPHVVVETSPGKYHAYWIINNSLKTSDFKQFQVALAKKFNGDESVSNLSRILRVPGYFHMKDPSNPFMTKVIQYNNGPMHDPGELAQSLQLKINPLENFGNNVVMMFPQKQPTPPAAGIIPCGLRDVTLFKMGAHLRHAGLSYDEIYSILSQKNRMHCQDPLDDGQVKKIAKQISLKESVVIRQLERQTPDDDSGESFNEKFNIYTFEDLGNMEIDPIKWVIPDFLPQGLTILAGDPKMGKSWIAQEISYAVATGGLALGRFPTIQGSVLHLALEDPPGRFKERMESIKGKEGTFPKDGNYTNKWKTMRDGGLNHLHLWLRQAKNPKLVIIDTLEKFRGSDSQTGNVYASDYKDMAKIQKLTIEYGIAVICIHHLNKSIHTDPMSRLSGSHGISGAADLVWLFDRKSRDVLSATLRAMGRDIPDARYNLSCDSDNKAIWKCLGHIVDEDRNNTQTKILDLLRDNETCSYTSGEIADKIGRSRQNTFKELIQLTKDELVVRYEENEKSYYGLNRAILGKSFDDPEYCD